jgi:integrase
MATIYQRGKKKTWHISYIVDGKRFWRSLKTQDKKLARFMKKDLEVKLKKGLHQDTQIKNIDSFYEEYVRGTAHRKADTNQTELYSIDKFLQLCAKTTINSIKTHDVQKYLLRYENMTPQSFNNNLGTIKRFLNKAVEKGYIIKNPADGIHRRKLPQVLPRFFTDDEYMQIEQTANGHPLFPMIATARYTGLRLRELIHLEWQDFDWENKLIKVLNKLKFEYTIKNYQARVVPISCELRSKLLPYIKQSGICFPVHCGKSIGEKYSNWGPKAALRKILAKSTIKNRKKIGWHEFRHTFASRLVQNNVPIYKVSKWLGHSSLAVTQIYAHFAPIYDCDIEKLSIQVNGESCSRASSRVKRYHNHQSASAA